MFKKISLIQLFVFAGFLIMGCQTTKPGVDPLAGNDSSFQAEAKGFSPNGDGFADEISLSLFVGRKEALSTWKINVLDGASVVRAYSGSSPAPADFSWDGKRDSGSLAAEGNYVAVASLTYGATDPVFEISTKAFALVLGAPKASITVDPASGFSLSATGVAASLSLTLDATAPFSQLESWDLDIFASDGSRFRSFEGKWPAGKISWDGKSAAGAFVTPLSSYNAMLTVRDEFGLEGKFSIAVPVGDLPPAIGQSTIAPRRSGFSPTTTSIKNTMDIVLSFGSKPSIRSWSVDIVSPVNGKMREFKGDSRDIPEFLAWDGKDTGGHPAQDGKYYALLSVDYGTAFKPVAVKSSLFSLVAIPPQGSLSIDPLELEYDGKGALNTATIIIRPLQSKAAVTAWRISISESGGAEKARFSGT